MVELTDLDPVFIADVRSSFSALDDDGLLALLSCLAASLEVGLTTLGARHVRRMAIVGPTGVGDLALAQRVLERLWDVSEGFQPPGDGAAFVVGISIENFKEKFMAARSEAPTYVNTLLDLAEKCYLPPHVEPLPRRGNEDGPLGPQSLQSLDMIAAALSGKGSGGGPSDYETRKQRVQDLPEKQCTDMLDNLYHAARPHPLQRPLLPEYECSPRHVSIASGMFGTNTGAGPRIKPVFQRRAVFQFEKVAGAQGRLVPGELQGSAPLAQCHAFLQFTDAVEANALLTPLHPSQLRPGVDDPENPPMSSGGLVYQSLMRALVRHYSEPSLTPKVAAQRSIALYEHLVLRVTSTTELGLGGFDDHVWPKLADFVSTLQFAHLPPLLSSEGGDGGGRAMTSEAEEAVVG